ncbi:MAG: TlpA family protein disulfide reductase, partial [Tannerella sp.]|nr:TlpA family protein disulfide reductase [Tannerella sp.]
MYDTIVAVNDRFHYEPEYQDTSMLFIYPRKGAYKRLTGGMYLPSSNRITLLWYPGKKIKINGVLTENSVAYRATGDEFNYDYSLVRDNVLRNLEAFKQIELQLDSLLYFRGDRVLTDSLFAERSEALKPVNNAEINYLLNNPDKELSAYYLSQLALDTIAKYHSRLSPAARNGLFKTLMEYQLNRYNDYMQVMENKFKIRPGNIAPDFTLPVIDGSALSLYSVNADFVVLDFWGSWCAPCISGIPKMKEYYQKYGRKVEFIGIACNDTEKDWKKAVDEHQPIWPQVINAGSDNVAVKYAVEAYPTKIIMDKNKTIIAVFRG